MSAKFPRGGGGSRTVFSSEVYCIKYPLPELVYIFCLQQFLCIFESTVHNNWWMFTSFMQNLGLSFIFRTLQIQISQLPRRDQDPHWNASHNYACTHPTQNLWFGRNVHLLHFQWPKSPWPKCSGRNVLGRNVCGRNFLHSLVKYQKLWAIALKHDASSLIWDVKLIAWLTFEGVLKNIFTFLVLVKLFPC